MTQDNLLNKLIFSLDISQERTGWSLLRGFNILKYGAVRSPKGVRGPTHPKFAELLCWYHDSIKELLENLDDEFKLDDIYVVVEDLNLRFNTSAKVLLQFQGAAKVALSEWVDSIFPINNATVKAALKIQMKKKFFSPELKNMAKRENVKEVKILMVDKINKMYKLNLKYQQNDEADSIAMATVFLTRKIKDGS